MNFIKKTVPSGNWKVVQSGDEPAALFRRAFKTAVTSNTPFAAWRLPFVTGAQIILGRKVHEVSTPINDDLPAFVAAPYDIDQPIQKIPAEVFIDLNNCQILYNQDSDTALFEDLHFFSRTGNTNDFLTGFAKPVSDFSNSTQRDDFCRTVDQAVSEISAGQLDKVVLSRILVLPVEPDFSTVEFFETLCRKYENAFVSLVVLPGQGIWIGATPELLFEWENDCIRTVSLAGTRQATPGNANGAWGKKEQFEQRGVTDYIESILSELDLTVSAEKSDRTLQIGNLQHLQTSFAIRDSRLRHGKLPEAVLQKLHPTPAVCGTPKEKAYDFILKAEQHDREFYAGYLGPVNIDSHAHLFVNLRCMQIVKNQAILYAGCGLTADSDPVKEWQETTDKLEALRQFFKVEREPVL